MVRRERGRPGKWVSLPKQSGRGGREIGGDKEGERESGNRRVSSERRGRLRRRSGSEAVAVAQGWQRLRFGDGGVVKKDRWRAVKAAEAA